MLDKDELIAYLSQLEIQAAGYAFHAKNHVATKAYAQAVAYGIVKDIVMGGQFDIGAPTDKELN